MLLYTDILIMSMIAFLSIFFSEGLILIKCYAPKFAQINVNVIIYVPGDLLNIMGKFSLKQCYSLYRDIEKESVTQFLDRQVVPLLIVVKTSMFRPG
jgi:hypothetical protein